MEKTTRFFVVLIVCIFVSTMAQAQNQSWTVHNRTDCSASIAVWQDSAGVVTEGSLTTMPNGTWAQPTVFTLNGQPGSFGIIKVKLESMNSPAAYYTHVSTFCCNPGDPCQVPNNCVTVLIYKSSKTNILMGPCIN